MCATTKSVLLQIGVATKYVASYDAPSEPLRKDLGWLSVKEMIVEETSTMMYKSLNDLAPKYLSDLFVRLSDFLMLELRNTKSNLQYR